MKYKYFIFYKPYNVLSQFTREMPEHITLKDFLQVDKSVYPIGRLDRDSEGLLLLTNDNRFKNIILDPSKKTPKTYCVQVDGDITQDAIKSLQKGVLIKHKKTSYKTLPCIVKKISSPVIEERDPPIRQRKNIPTSWIELTITEGKNRQVRKMCAKVGFPVLRLIRRKIGDLEFDDVRCGSYRELSTAEVKQLANH